LQREKKYKWHKIADSADEITFNSSGLHEVDIAGKRICVAKGSNGLYACTAKCPHAGGVMATGEIDSQDNIVCPLHRYKFSLTNGRNVSGEGYYLKTFPVEIRDDGVFVGVEDGSLLRWI
jgi:nitrite reductase/ring-hydroxylating ferredoxin subunit